MPVVSPMKSTELNDTAATPAADLFYGLNDKPPLRLSCFVALQHVLALFVGIVTPPTLIARALQLSAADGAFLVSMALLTSGLGTVLQTRKVGPVGSGLLNIQGTSFVFVAPVVSLAEAGGSSGQALGAVFGTCLVASLVPILLAPFIRAASRMITPLVTGIVVTLIGLT